MTQSRGNKQIFHHQHFTVLKYEKLLMTTQLLTANNQLENSVVETP
ncbi:hypothetical protein [Okeania sp. SIO2B3]|nr:hypothetical protein [Okeania sp. SIO2B3]NET40693.1 hypothetical protein [Okeania sp. SIO2B3]